MSDLVHRPSSLLTEREQARLTLKARSARSERTLRSYAGQWALFEGWAAKMGFPARVPVSPEVAAAYISSLDDRGLSPATLRVASAAIAFRHREARALSPTLDVGYQEVLRGCIRRGAKAGRGRGRAAPLLPDYLAPTWEQLVLLPHETTRARDRAILTLGAASGLRCSELSALRFSDLVFEGSAPHDAVRIRLRTSKTDQEGQGHERRVCRGDHPETCPVGALEDWIRIGGIRRGYVFRALSPQGQVRDRALSTRRIDEIVRGLVGRAARSSGLIPNGRFSSHSLRAGFATAAALAGKPIHEIARHLDHKSIQTTGRYVRDAEVRKSDVTRGIGF